MELHAQINNVFQDKDPEKALESIVDGNLKGSYPMEDAYKVSINESQSSIVSVLSLSTVACETICIYNNM